MANYLFIRGNRNKSFFSNVGEELEKMGHKCHLIKLELGELLFKSKIYTDFAPFKVDKREYPIPDETLLNLPIYNITFTKRILNKNISSKELRTYKRYMYYIDQFLDEQKIDIICLFNGYHWIDQITKYLAELKGIKIYYFEDGLFRPYTITCDTHGINACSSVSQAASFYDQMEINQKRLKKYLFKPENPSLLKQSKENLFFVAFVKAISMFGSFLGLHPRFYAHITFSQAVKYFVFKKLFRKKKKDSITLPEEFIFVPFQVARDTQIFYHSPNIKTMEELLSYVYEAVENYNKIHSTNINIVVKEHPEDMSRNNYKELKRKYKNNNRVLFVQKMNVKELIEKSQAVITINSTVGIEALALKKRVITLGEALYNVEGVVHKCSNPNLLFETMEKSFNTLINISRIDKFLYYLRFNYQIEGVLNSPNKQNAINVANRISGKNLN